MRRQEQGQLGLEVVSRPTERDDKWAKRRPNVRAEVGGAAEPAAPPSPSQRNRCPLIVLVVSESLLPRLAGPRKRDDAGNMGQVEGARGAWDAGSRARTARKDKDASSSERELTLHAYCRHPPTADKMLETLIGAYCRHPPTADKMLETLIGLETLTTQKAQVTKATPRQLPCTCDDGT
eukprot:75736-Pleurochrysis_carterae.AAC.2